MMHYVRVASFNLTGKTPEDLKHNRAWWYDLGGVAEWMKDEFN